MGAFLKLIKPEKLSLITIMEIMRLSGTGGIADGMKTARSLLTVGKAIENEYKAEVCKKNGLEIPTTLTRGNERGFFSSKNIENLHARRAAAARYLNDNEEWTAEWSQILRVKVGSFLVDNLMNLATVTREAVDKRTGEKVYVCHGSGRHLRNTNIWALQYSGTACILPFIRVQQGP
jgi:DNA-directed RNA polymerase, mitochondrial